MQITYDHTVDALYIKLTDHLIVKTKPVNNNFILDTDESGEVVGIEILNARKSGIDPLALQILHSTADHQTVEPPDPEEIRKGREAKMEALKRMHEKAEHPR